MKHKTSLSFPRSDHFDGKRFFNPTSTQAPGAADFLKFIVSYRPKAWPKNVQNTPKLDLQRRLANSEVAVTFVNHATLLIQTPSMTILTDPVWSRRVSPVQFAGPKRVRQPGIAFNDLPRIDVVLISHNHYDHMDLEAVRRLAEKYQPVFLVALGDKRRIEKCGAKKVYELDWWQSERVNGAEFTFAPTQHFSSRTPFDRNKSLWGSFAIQLGEKKIYFGGDAGYSTHYADIQKRLGTMDLSFLPIGAYEPRWFMKAVHMNPEEAVQAHIDLKSKRSIGIHFGSFQLTEEPIDQPVADLNTALQKFNLPLEDFVVLPEGQTKVFAL